MWQTGGRHGSTAWPPWSSYIWLGCRSLLQVRSSAATVVNEKTRNKNIFASSGTKTLAKAQTLVTYIDISVSMEYFDITIFSHCATNCIFGLKIRPSSCAVAKMDGGNMFRLNAEIDVGSNFV